MNSITELLNLEDADIFISNISINGTKKILTLETKPIRHFCPVCGFKMYSRGIKIRTINHPVLQDGYELVLKLKQRRWRCTNTPCSYTINESFNFVDKRKRNTNATDMLIIHAFRDLSVSASSIASKYKVSDTYVLDTFDRYVKMDRLPLSDIISVDEVCLDLDPKGTFYNAHNFCIHRYHCKKTNVCGKIILCNIKCTSCPTCNQTCADFVRERCNRLDKAPYVCNGCPKAINHCTIAHKYRYDAIFANRKYRECLSSSRSGINMTKQELHKKDMIITPLIYQGQSPYQIITNHPELDLSVRTLYSYLDDGILTARNIDLKRKVKFKPRKVHKTQIKDRTVFEGRMFTDFQMLSLDSFAEMDTVHSSQESKRVILTFFLAREKLFLAFIMNRCTKGAVKLIFDKLERQLGTYEFLTLFHTILTDRESEFGDPETLETGVDGMVRSSIYFCDPMRSGQKGGIEQAHTMLRMVLPKKTSFEFLTQ